MNTDIHAWPPKNQLLQAAGESARRASEPPDEITTSPAVAGVGKDVGRDAPDATKEAVKRAAATAKDAYQSAAQKARDTLGTSKKYVRNEPSNHPPTPLSMQEGVNVLLSNAGQGLRHRYHKCENQIRKSPTTAVLGAVAVGYLLHRLPLRAILVTKVRVLSALTPPALFLFGAAKLYEFLQRQELAKQK